MTDVAHWLRANGFDRLVDIFSENEIDGQVLVDLTNDDLKELGIALGTRKKLLRAIKHLQEELPSSSTGGQEAPASAGTPPAAAVERRQMTVMFCDLVGSTALSGRLDPEELRGVIMSYQNAVAGEITRFEGHVAKFMGDGVLAYFGWPRAHEDDGERAVRAGLSIMDALSGLRAPSGEALAARIGIASGLVVIGDLVGEGAAQEEAVIGETPNIASRLQDLASPGQIVLAEGTRQLLGGVFELSKLGAHELKGIARPVEVFAVLGVRTLETRFEGRASEHLAPMVGRDLELDQLLERWSQAKSGEGQDVLIVAEAGMGKSRIAKALLDAVADQHCTQIQYQCSPYHTDTAFWPVIQKNDNEWEDLKNNYSFSFKNKPYNFHNGGIWPVWMGLFCLGLSNNSLIKEAEKIIQDFISVITLQNWNFNEYISGDNLKLSGKEQMGFSASGIVFMYHALNFQKCSKKLGL